MGMEAADPRAGGRLKDIRGFIDSLYGHDLHAKRVDSLAAATLGVMTGASLAVAMIGQALAQARGLVTKHAIKQVDRLLTILQCRLPLQFAGLFDPCSNQERTKMLVQHRGFSAREG